MARRVLAALFATGSVLMMDVDALAQMELTTPPGERSRPDSGEPAVRPRPRPALAAPAFLMPLARETKTDRAGVAFFTGLSTPVTPRGGPDSTTTGWLGFGIAAEWGRSTRRSRTN